MNLFHFNVVIVFKVIYYKIIIVSLMKQIIQLSMIQLIIKPNKKSCKRKCVYGQFKIV